MIKRRRTSASARDAEAEAREVEEFLRGCRSEERHDPFPLTDLQSAYWLGERRGLELGEISVHAYLEFDLEGLDVPRLERAIDRVVAHHPMLRAVVDDDGHQRILPEVPRYRVPVVDLSQKDERTERETLRVARESAVDRGPQTHEWPTLEFFVHRLRSGLSRLHVDLPILFCDGTSISLVLKDVQRLYEDPEDELDPVDIWPRDYLRAILAQRRSGPYKRSLEYWRSRLPTLPSGPELPVDTAPSQKPPKFCQHLGELDADTWGRVKELAGRHGLTSATTVMAVYADVMASFSRSQRFLLNVLAQARVPCHPHIGRLVGNYSATLMLEIDNTRNESFVDRAQRLRAQLRRDLEHVRVSGVQVARELGRAMGGLSRPIAPVVFASGLTPPKMKDPDSFGPWGARCVFESIQTPQVWIDHQIREQNGRMVFTWDSVDDLFPPNFMNTLFEVYTERLNALGRDDAAWTRTERRLVPAGQLEQRAEVNRVEAHVPPQATLHSLFADRASADPEALAVISNRRRLTYGELERWSRTVARGLPRGGLVAIYMHRGWEQIVAALSILGAGSAYLPIDPALPEKRVRFLLDNGGVEFVITQPALRRAAEALDRNVVVLDEMPAEEDDPGAPLPVAGPRDLAYVIYTSGSTGTPKGVMIDHRGAVNTVLDINRRFGVGSSDRVFALASLSFDLSVYDVFGTLAAGAAVVLPDAELDREPSHWVELMERERVSVWNSVPQLMVMLVEYLGHRTPKGVDHLRLVLLSGDWVPVSLPDRLRAIAPKTRFIAMGGATEASIWSIFHEVDHVDPSWKSIPYGRPLSNQSWHVLNDWLEPSPTWVPGELHIGGIGLALGYLGDEEITSAKFIEHDKLGRLYRTGDMGRYLPDGSIEFLGREDAQVKVQGYRIELGEIEAAVQEHANVKAAVVLATEPRKGERRLVAFVVPESGELGAPELREFTATRVPEYMVPASFTSLPELPLSGNGKIDRKALEVSQPERAEVAAPRLPTTDVETRLCAIWEDLLEVRPIGTNQNFFELGGQSFVAVRLMARILRDFGVDLPVTSLVGAGTVGELAAVIDDKGGVQTSLVPMTSSAAEPIFCVHPSGGSVLCYRDLAHRLEDRVQFFGLEAPGLRGDLEAHGTIEGLAARYVEAVRAHKPHGPYLLAGWSSGGAVAMAMAHALRAAGEEVTKLMLLDTELPGVPAVEDEDEDVMTRKFVSDLLRLGAGAAAADEAVRALAEGSHGGGDSTRAAYELLRERQLLPGEFTMERFAQLRTVYATNLRALHTYEPAPYGGDLWLFCARDGLVGDAGHAPDGWQTLVTGRLEVVDIPGDHYTMFDDGNLGVLVREMTRALAAGGAPSEPSSRAQRSAGGRRTKPTPVG